MRMRLVLSLSTALAAFALEAKTVRFDFPQWETNTWVFLPACAYNGNRDFAGVKAEAYPPGPSAAGRGLEPRREIRETIPKLNPDGTGEIEVTSGDMSVPCAGFWFPVAKKGTLIFTEAQYKGENIGYTVRAGELRLDYPARRKTGYRFNRPRLDAPDAASEPAPEGYEPKIRRIDFAAENVTEFLERFFRERKCVMSSPRAPNLYTRELLDETLRCWNRHMFVDGAYCQERLKWMPGWCAGPISVFPLYKFGDAETKARCRQTLDFMVAHQTAAGVFTGCPVGEGKMRPPRRRTQVGDEMRDFLRIHCDGLWNLCKCFRTMEPTDEWKAAAKRGADALVRIWRSNGQFGQWVDAETLEIVAGRTDSCAIAPAALVEAWRVFKEPGYLKVADEACTDYCRRDLERGVVYGGPADCLMAPDSESAIALLESCVALAEATGEDRFVGWARAAAALCSTWVMPYAYEFPPGSPMALHRVNSTGSVFANVQNKHSAPGFCTMSGKGLLKLYRLTGDAAYLELLKDVASYIPQSVSRADDPYVAKDGRKLDPGFICERVNTSDWEGKENIGGSIFYASCWCGSALLSTWAELLDEPEFGEGETTTEITVDTGKARFPTAPDLWGIFFEDIDLSLDGGISAEMVRNRSFEDGRGNPREFPLGYWDPVGDAECFFDWSKPITPKNRHCACVRGNRGAGIANQGYFGHGIRKGMEYRLSLAVRGRSAGPVDVALEAYGKPALAVGTIPAIGDDWRTHELVLTADDSDPQARLVIRLREGGEMYLDCVSMFPADAVAGLFRRDLVEKLKALKPSFMRFPGGCWVEGDTMDKAYRWKKTLGSVWERDTVWNIWKYWATNGVGFHEFLLLAEVLGAKPLYCINVGMSHRETVPMEKMDEFVQDALDCLEYANGPTNTVWGAKRAAAGHPAPFGLAYLEIGNENGGKPYEERYALMAKAVRAKHPDVKLIFDNWSTTKRVDDPKDLRDDHFYRTPDCFMGELAHEYDARKGDFDIFVGEYAVTARTHRYGSLRGAIGEAAFMLGLERNQDQVRMAAYAPLFAHAQHTVWSPNLIYQTTTGSFVNPSWNVQKLFSENRGAEVLGVSVKTGRHETDTTEPFGNGDRHNVIDNVQASAVRAADGAVIVKLVNCTDIPQPFRLNLAGRVRRTVFTGSGRLAHNSPSEPEALKERVGDIEFDGSGTLPPLSLTVLKEEKR